MTDLDDLEKTLKRIEKLLTRIADKVAPEDKKPVTSAAEVSSITVERGHVRGHEPEADLPRQLEDVMVKRGDRYRPGDENQGGLRLRYKADTLNRRGPMGEAKRRRDAGGMPWQQMEQFQIDAARAVDANHKPGFWACPFPVGTGGPDEARDDIPADRMHETRCADCGKKIVHMKSAPPEVMKVCTPCGSARMKNAPDSHRVFLQGPSSVVRRMLEEAQPGLGA